MDFGRLKANIIFNGESVSIRYPKSPIRNHFRHADRLHGRKAFSAVYDAKARKASGPLLVFTKANDAGRHRLGLSVSRRVGRAVVRSRVKRMVREAFRLHRHGWPGNYDLVVVVRPHEPMALEDYVRHLTEAVAAGHRLWARRATRKDEA
ncbi:MAG: ribonuclease P protein component [Planctomycetota bacterium]